MTTKQKPNDIEDPKLRAIAAEFPDFADQIVAGASYGKGHWTIQDEDPQMRYYFAFPGGADRSDSVESVKRLGYRVSEKKHDCPDLILMETPRALYNYRKEQERKQRDARMAAVKREAGHGDAAKGLEVVRDGDVGFQKMRGG